MIRVFIILCAINFILIAGEKEIVKQTEMGLYQETYKKIIYHSYVIKKQQQELEKLHENIAQIKKENMLLELQANKILEKIKNYPSIEFLLIKENSLNLIAEQIISEMEFHFKTLEKRDVNYILTN